MLFMYQIPSLCYLSESSQQPLEANFIILFYRLGPEEVTSPDYKGRKKEGDET